jgi:hypothetical protein
MDEAEVTAARRPSRLSLVVRDPQFWVPVAVLAGGLLVLWWIS